MTLQDVGASFVAAGHREVFAQAASISSIALEVDGVAAADALIEAFVAVPEPGTAALLGLGLSGLAWVGRRRSAA